MNFAFSSSRKFHFVLKILLCVIFHFLKKPDFSRFFPGKVLPDLPGYQNAATGFDPIYPIPELAIPEDTRYPENLYPTRP